MSGTASALRKHWLELVWALFAAANVAAIIVAPEWETFPSHLLWVSLMLLYGFHVWRLSATAAVLTAVVLGVGGALTWAAYTGSAGWDELIEVPLMAAVFVAAAWHARRRETALERAERSAAKEREFVRDASHQLRTPITVARGHVELIASADAGEEVARDAEVALGELDRLEAISDGLLIIAAADHPGFLGREAVDLERVIVNTARRWGAAAPRRWLVDVRAEGTVPADEVRLLTALDALVENAVKFTQDDDRIAIVGRAEGDVAVLEVSDSGIGIPSESLPRVFDRFSRSDGGGTGLGLAIVKAIAEAHGGSVGARSEPGQGATFEIRLPGFRPAEPSGLDREPDATGPGYGRGAVATKSGASGRKRRAGSATRTR